MQKRLLLPVHGDGVEYRHGIFLHFAFGDVGRRATTKTLIKCDQHHHHDRACKATIMTTCNGIFKYTNISPSLLPKTRSYSPSLDPDDH